MVMKLTQSWHGGDERSGLYVIGVQKFLSGFTSYVFRGSAACYRPATGYHVASWDSLVLMDQDVG